MSYHPRCTHPHKIKIFVNDDKEIINLYPDHDAPHFLISPICIYLLYNLSNKKLKDNMELISLFDIPEEEELEEL